MGTISVYTAKLEVHELRALILSRRAEAPYAILERPDKPDFPGSSETIDPAVWPAGRVFGEEVEICWEQDGAAWKLRLITSTEPAPAAHFKKLLDLCAHTSKQVRYYLRGEDDIAVAGRVSYARAIPGSGRGQLSVLEYRDEEGRLEFYRYVGLERE